jgi:hypothetical protein
MLLCDAAMWQSQGKYVMPMLVAAAAGYCGARGKFDDPEVVKAVSETLTTLCQFLDKQLE